MAERGRADDDPRRPGRARAAAVVDVPHAFSLFTQGLEAQAADVTDRRPTASPAPRPSPSDPRRFWNLTLTLARTDWKVRFFGSALGYVWSLLRPLMLFGILYFVFSEVVGAGDDVEHFAWSCCRG